MKNKTGWIIAIVIVLVLLLALPAGYLLGRAFPWSPNGVGERGMMDGRAFPPFDGRGMMDRGYMHPFSWGMMLLGWLVPAGILVLVIVGIVVLVNALMRPKSSAPTPVAAPVTAPAAETAPLPPPAPLRACASCGKLAQADWSTCPYCGSPLT